MRLPPSPIYSAISSGEKTNINNTNNKFQELWSTNHSTASGLTSASTYHITVNTSNANDTKNKSLPKCELPDYDGCKYKLQLFL